MSQQSLLVSIILPFADHRGQINQSLDSFLNQTLDRDAFELIVPCGDEVPELDSRLRRSRPLRIVQKHGANEVDLYNIGAHHARGKYLYLSEMHCVAKPDCVEEAIKAAVDQDCDCINSHSTGINDNKIAAMEQWVFEQDMNKLWKSGERKKVTLRGFLIKRQVWKAAGGFQPEFGHISEVILGRHLTATGKKFGYAEKSVVAHYNNTSLLQLISELITYGHDECRSNHIAPATHEQFLSMEWQRYRDDPSSASVKLGKLYRRLSHLSWILRLTPGWSFWYPLVYRQMWSTSIRIGRLLYLKELAEAQETEQTAILPAA